MLRCCSGCGGRRYQKISAAAASCCRGRSVSAASIAAAVAQWPVGLKVTVGSSVVFVLALCVPVLDLPVRACAATTGLMATWWIVRYVPIGITSLLPVVIFPPCGVAAAKEIASAYYNDTVFLLIGTCVIALALERTNALTRLAFRVLTALPSSEPRVVLLVFMLILSLIHI